MCNSIILGNYLSSIVITEIQVSIAPERALCPFEVNPVCTSSPDYCRLSAAAQPCPTVQPRGLHRPPGSSVRGMLQARILEWVASPPPVDLANPGIEPRSPALQAVALPLSRQGSPVNFPPLYICLFWRFI